jgi:hypothetical protein
MSLSKLLPHLPSALKQQHKGVPLRFAELEWREIDDDVNDTGVIGS